MSYDSCFGAELRHKLCGEPRSPTSPNLYPSVIATLVSHSTVNSYKTIAAESLFLHSLSPNKGAWHTEQHFNSNVYTFRSTVCELIQFNRISMLIYGFTNFTQELRSQDTPDVIDVGPDPLFSILLFFYIVF